MILGILHKRRSAQAGRRYQARRVPEIRAALAQAQPGFVFLVGNSHAEALGIELARTMPVVNGGIGGSSARGYAAELEHLPFRARAGSALLIVRTNDILRRANPLSPATSAGFAAAVTRILGWLRPHADRVLVAAVPPLGADAITNGDPAAVVAYSDVLRRLCFRQNCRFFDPFAALRDQGEGLTSQAHPDGVHLGDYVILAQALVPILDADRAFDLVPRHGSDEAEVRPRAWHPSRSSGRGRSDKVVVV